MRHSLKYLIIVSLFMVFCFAAASAQNNSVTITLAAYTVPREAYAQIIPLFQAYWLEETGQEVTFQESYLGSGAQSRAVAGGFEADLVALSLEGHVTNLVDAGLITHDWKANPYGGMISTSVVAFVVRSGNPRNIADWDDLAQPGVEVITPDPATSGGAQWNIMAAYGAAIRGYVEGYTADGAGARQFLFDLFTNVSVMDAGARESFLTFESGVGDVAITYEDEYYAAIIAGGECDIVYPTSTILIENPLALVDVYADAHGTREVTEAFIEFLYRPESQAIFAASGFRPPVLKNAPTETAEVTPEAETTPAAEGYASFWPEGLDEELFPPLVDLFTIDDFGGWTEVVPTYFGENGIYTQVIAEVQGQ